MVDSMYQNGEFANYLFGGRYNEKSFVKDFLPNLMLKGIIQS